MFFPATPAPVHRTTHAKARRNEAPEHSPPPSRLFAASRESLQENLKESA